MFFSVIRVFNNKTKKVARNLRTDLNAFTEWKAKERKTIMYFPHCGVNIWYRPGLLPVPEEYMLLFSREIDLRHGT